jgi:GDP-L-fucose synthase
MDKNAKIYVAGHRGLVGSALMRQLEAQGYKNIVTRTHTALDLTNQQDGSRFF